MHGARASLGAWILAARIVIDPDLQNDKKAMTEKVAALTGSRTMGAEGMIATIMAIKDSPGGPIAGLVRLRTKPDPEGRASHETGSQEPASQDAGSQEPKSQDAGSQEPASQDAGSQEPASQDAGSQEPTSQEPASEDAGSQEPASEEVGSQEPASEEVGSQEPASEEVGSQEPASQDAGSQEPASEEPASQDAGSQDTGEETENIPTIKITEMDLLHMLELAQDEKAIADIFMATREKNGIDCPKCGRKDTTRKIGPSRPTQFRCSACDSIYSIRTGTPMEGPNIPISKWATAAYLATVRPELMDTDDLASLLRTNIGTASHISKTVIETCTGQKDPIAALATVRERAAYAPEEPDAPEEPEEPEAKDKQNAQDDAPETKDEPDEPDAQDNPDKPDEPEQMEDNRDNGPEGGPPRPEGNSPAPGDTLTSVPDENPQAENPQAENPAPATTQPNAKGRGKVGPRQEGKTAQSNPGDPLENLPRGMSVIKRCPHCGASGIVNDEEFGPKCIMCNRPIRPEEGEKGVEPDAIPRTTPIHAGARI